MFTDDVTIINDNKSFIISIWQGEAQVARLKYIDRDVIYRIPCTKYYGVPNYSIADIRLTLRWYGDV